MSAILLGSPLAGWASPLDEVPDPVFAERMVGEGVAVDPVEGIVVAPAAARVVAVAPTGHSVTLELGNGAQILIHVGLETMALGGDGFAIAVAEGQEVKAGDVLIRFDLDSVARRAKSLVTPIVLVNDGYSVEIRAIGRMVARGDALMAIAGAGASASAKADGAPIERVVVVPLANGLHARPAAKIVNLVKTFQAHIEIVAHDRTADARSMVALMALGLKRGDAASVRAIGRDARQAADAVVALIESGMDEAEPGFRPAAPAERSGLGGICASPGLAVGPVARFSPAPIAVPVDGAGPAAERRALDDAIAAVAAGLAGASGIEAAHLGMLEDPCLLADAWAEIDAGRSAGHAWRMAGAAAAQALRATGDALLIERIADLEDVEQQILTHLTGVGLATPTIAADAILVAEELLPSQFLALGARVAGICTARGGPTSHVAILAAAAGIPMLVACGPDLLALPDGRFVIVDAESGRIDADPDPAARAAAQARQARSRARAAAENAAASEECRMADGVRIEIFANLASDSDAARAVAAGAEGCGLLRTEFLFLDRDTPPSEDEQAEAYRRVAAALGGRPLIVRTLDIGGDKPVPYLPLPAEPNPALGRRGIRLGLAFPDLLAVQLRAILRGVPGGQCRIMVPMIVERDELRAVRAALDAAIRAVGRDDKVQLGVMIETPAAALLAAGIAEEADFLSVGTNDLSQYALACDRGNDAVAAMIDALHPAVLHLIRHAAEGARRHGRWLGICGGIASDPNAAAILIGLGATELSASPAAIPALKAVVRGLRLDECMALADRALACASAGEVRALLADAQSALRGTA